MFYHNFKYSLRILFKNKSLIFWTFAFPIILATFFHMAFSDIEKKEKLDIIDIAVVDNEMFQDNSLFQDAFEELGNESSEIQMFNISYVEEELAKELLSKNKITGYLILEDENTPKVVVNQNGINETVFQFIVEEINQMNEMFQRVSEKKIEDFIKEEGYKTGEYISWSEKLYQDTILLLNEENTKIEDISNNNLSYTMIEFYTLIAMTCLYGGILGMAAINKCLANMSQYGKRVATAPVSKGKLILSSVLASYITQLIGILLLFLYTIFILNVDYGSHLPFVILLTLVGFLAGLSLGIFTSTVCKTNENVKTGIILSFTMLGCFLSGMMGITMKYIIDKNIPIINKINPANMITDGFYSLYYYGVGKRFYFNVLSLIIFSLSLIVLSINSLRRQKYDTI